MTTMIMAADRTEARNVARHLKLLEWYFVDSPRTFAAVQRPVIVLAPGAARHEQYYEIIRAAQARNAHIYEVDAWREKFMFVALLVKLVDGGEPLEREEYVRDEYGARALDGKGGWLLVWYGKAGEAPDGASLL